MLEIVKNCKHHIKYYDLYHDVSYRAPLINPDHMELFLSPLHSQMSTLVHQRKVIQSLSRCSKQATRKKEF